MQYLSGIIVLFLAIIQNTAGFSGLFKRNHQFIRHIQLASTSQGGKHGENFKFMPLLRGYPDDPFPRIIYIAGVYPDLTIDDVLAPKSPPAAEPGKWSYDFPDPDGPQLGAIAVPGSELIDSCIDPVAVIAKNTDLSVNYAEEVECVVIIDRGNQRFSSDDFYLFQNLQDSSLSIQWMQTLPATHRIIGKIIICMLPYSKLMKPKSTGFLEEDEE
jgi:hypothetical protein